MFSERNRVSSRVPRQTASLTEFSDDENTIGLRIGDVDHSKLSTGFRLGG
jgi:hypothetical protein